MDCSIFETIHKVFNMLRVLAFVGAAFCIGGWAWAYISKGEVGMEDVKKKGIGLLVGFVLLMGISVLLTWLINSSVMQQQLGLECLDVFETW